MKISPMAASSGTPGQTLGSVDVGRSASPMRLERAKAVAAGQTPAEPVENLEQPRPNVRSLKMKTNFSTNRDMDSAQQLTEALADKVEAAPAQESSTSDTVEQGAVEATQPLSPQFAALAKQKRAFQLEKAEFEKQKAEQATRSNGFDPEQFKARMQSDPLGVLQEHGVTYDALTEAILSDKNQENPKILALEQQIKALKEGVDSRFTERDTQAEKQVLGEIRKEADQLVAQGDDFEMIRGTKSQ